MRRLVLCVVICAAAGCASTDGIPTLRQDCDDRYDTVWIAAQTAVGRLGGRVVSANSSAGAILGRLDSDVLGTEIDLHINLSRLPDHQPGTQQPVTVTVKAVDTRVTEPDANRIEDLRSLEDRYLRLVGERAACGGPI
jgi:PAS domain-containing protein